MTNKELHAILTDIAADNVVSYQSKNNAEHTFHNKAVVTINAGGRVRVSVDSNWYHTSKSALAQMKAIRLALIDAKPEGVIFMRETRKKSAVFRTGFWNMGAFDTTGFYSTFYVKS